MDGGGGNQFQALFKAITDTDNSNSTVLEKKFCRRKVKMAPSRETKGNPSHSTAKKETEEPKVGIQDGNRN